MLYLKMCSPTHSEEAYIYIFIYIYIYINICAYIYVCVNITCIRERENIHHTCTCTGKALQSLALSMYVTPPAMDVTLKGCNMVSMGRQGVLGICGTLSLICILVVL